MAQRVHIVLEDDIDGGDATETVLFGVDGINYEIDLSDKNASKLRDSLACQAAPLKSIGRTVLARSIGRSVAVSSTRSTI